MSEPARQLAPGTRLDDKWRLDGVLGQGGAATVYAATHLRNGLSVAVKVLHPEVGTIPEVRSRFLREGYVANRVEHPGTVRVLDDGITRDGTVYLVMERLYGITLDDMAAHGGGALGITDVVRYGDKLLDVLARAHEKGIVHRDLKPENVFVCADGTLKVLDFGIARIQDAHQGARMTMQNVSMGTPAFMPPEQALGRWELVDARSDVFAIGASLYTLLTGQLVHPGQTMQEIMVLMSTRPVASIRSVLPGLPAEIASVIDRALAFDRAQRWPDAGAMGGAFRAAVARYPQLAAVLTQAPLPLDPRVIAAVEARAREGHPSHVVTTRPVAATPPQARRVPLVVGAFVVAGVLLGVGGVMLALGGRAGEAARPEPTIGDVAPASASVATPAAAPGAPSASPQGTAAPPPPAESSAVAASATSAPSTSAPPTGRVAPKPPQPVVCKRDSFTMRCPCARCE